MKVVIIKKNKTPINWWLIFFVIIIISVVFIVYFLSYYTSLAQQDQTLSVLNSECAAYANTLTQELAVNSSACQTAKNEQNLSQIASLCGTVAYCYYSSACQNAGPAIPNKLSCLCDGFQSSKIIFTGFCNKNISI